MNNLANRIIFTDEAHFHLCGFVNRQLLCKEECDMHPLRTTVWCGLWAGGVIGPFFFVDFDGNAVTVNGEGYREVVRNNLWPALGEVDRANMWFQQDGATCHTSRETITLLHEKLEWLPRSCDLWGYVKSKVYVTDHKQFSNLRKKFNVSSTTTTEMSVKRSSRTS